MSTCISKDVNLYSQGYQPAFARISTFTREDIYLYSQGCQPLFARISTCIRKDINLYSQGYQPVFAMILNRIFANTFQARHICLLGFCLQGFLSLFADIRNHFFTRIATGENLKLFFGQNVALRKSRRALRKSRRIVS